MSRVLDSEKKVQKSLCSSNEIMRVQLAAENNETHRRIVVLLSLGWTLQYLMLKLPPSTASMVECEAAISSILFHVGPTDVLAYFKYFCCNLLWQRHTSCTRPRLPLRNETIFVALCDGATVTLHKISDMTQDKFPLDWKINDIGGVQFRWSINSIGEVKPVLLCSTSRFSPLG